MVTSELLFIRSEETKIAFNAERFNSGVNGQDTGRVLLRVSRMAINLLKQRCPDGELADFLLLCLEASMNCIVSIVISWDIGGHADLRAHESLTTEQARGLGKWERSRAKSTNTVKSCIIYMHNVCGVSTFRYFQSRLKESEKAVTPEDVSIGGRPLYSPSAQGRGLTGCLIPGTLGRLR